MRVHHLNCGCMCPVGGPLMDGFSPGLKGRLVCHCLLVEHPAGLVLVDTGFGENDVRRPYPRLSRLYGEALDVRFERRFTAKSRLEALGFDPADVRHVVLTHLDFDHAGGLQDFPQARVHLTAAEIDAAKARRGFVAKNRYRPAQWTAESAWRGYSDREAEDWAGLRAIPLEGLADMALVPLPGHTWGHAGVAVRAETGWKLLAGDAYFFRGEMKSPPRRTPGLELYQTLMEVDRERRLENQALLRRLAADRDAGVDVFCSHDAVELHERQVRSPSPPANRRPDAGEARTPLH